MLNIEMVWSFVILCVALFPNVVTFFLQAEEDVLLAQVTVACDDQQ